MTTDIRHLVPEHLRVLSERATPGELTADGDTKDVTAMPYGSRFLGERSMVARCAVGGEADDAAFLATAANFVRMLLRVPAGQETHVLEVMAAEDRLDASCQEAKVRGDEEGLEILRAQTGAMMPYERSMRREDETARTTGMCRAHDIDALGRSYPDLDRTKRSVLLSLRRHSGAKVSDIAARLDPPLDEATALEALLDLRARRLAYRPFHEADHWTLTREGENVVLGRDSIGLLGG